MTADCADLFLLALLSGWRSPSTRIQRLRLIDAAIMHEVIDRSMQIFLTLCEESSTSLCTTSTHGPSPLNDSNDAESIFEHGNLLSHLLK